MWNVMCYDIETNITFTYKHCKTEKEARILLKELYYRCLGFNDTMKFFLNRG